MLRISHLGTDAFTQINFPFTTTYFYVHILVCKNEINLTMVSYLPQSFAKILLQNIVKVP